MNKVKDNRIEILWHVKLQFFEEFLETNVCVCIKKKKGQL